MCIALATTGKNRWRNCVVNVSWNRAVLERLPVFSDVLPMRAGDRLRASTQSEVRNGMKNQRDPPL